MKILAEDQSKSPVMTIGSVDVKRLEEPRSTLKQQNSNYSLSI